jgi:hypothetical protein
VAKKRGSTKRWKGSGRSRKRRASSDPADATRSARQPSGSRQGPDRRAGGSTGPAKAGARGARHHAQGEDAAGGRITGLRLFRPGTSMVLLALCAGVIIYVVLRLQVRSTVDYIVVLIAAFIALSTIFYHLRRYLTKYYNQLVANNLKGEVKK